MAHTQRCTATESESLRASLWLYSATHHLTLSSLKGDSWNSTSSGSPPGTAGCIARSLTKQSRALRASIVRARSKQRRSATGRSFLPTSTFLNPRSQRTAAMAGSAEPGATPTLPDGERPTGSNRADAARPTNAPQLERAICVAAEGIQPQIRGKSLRGRSQS